ncbi:MAG: hypothetical protein J6X59_07690 [Bacteroidales bacterium]|nr:hypothetical protein [Bacteroidales bacterium]
MNKISIFAAMLLGSLALFSCNKENDKESACIPEGAVMLSTEGFRGDEKTSVSDNSVQWTGTDESIRFYVGGVGANEQTLAVSVIGDNAFVPGITGSGAIRGYYPVSIITADGASDHETVPTVVVPDSYDCRYVAGRQEIALPMVASAASGAGEIEFKHVTAAVKVLVKNETGFDLTLDKVVVSSSAYKLSGTVNTTLADNDLSLIPQAGSGSVTVRFTDAPTIAAGGDDIKEIQVPILPIGESQLTIEVYTHIKVGTVLGIEGLTNANYDFHYSCTPEGNTPALGRNHMATARIALKRAANTASPAIMTEIDHSLFTINGSGDKVRFSKGNLKYSNGIWSFHTHQYDRCFTSNGDVSSSYTSSGTFDLFGWGTSGNNYCTAYQPWSTSTTATEYGPTGTVDLTIGDWGIANAISPDAAGTWHTLSKNDWSYIVNTRSNSTINGTGNARYTEARINTDGTPVKGVILFPDNYSAGTPDGVTWGAINGKSSWGTECTSAGWASMEAAGCVFLPAAGYRIGTTTSYTGSYGYYWLSSAYDASNAYSFRFMDNNVYLSTSRSRHIGSAVRLVRNAN